MAGIHIRIVDTYSDGYVQERGGGGGGVWTYMCTYTVTDMYTRGGGGGIYTYVDSNIYV